VDRPTSIEDAVAEPAVVEPAVVEPAVVEPAVVEPAVVEPAVVEPAVVEPAVAVGGAARARRFSAAGAVIGLLLGLLGFALVVQLKAKSADAELSAARP
jgi:hypothetical protein